VAKKAKLRPERVGRFRFRKNDSVGVPDAEEDQNFLRDCFVDTGDVDVLSDCSNPKRIVLGRTGTGKTALLGRLEQHGHVVIRIKPESLALSYISNSNILKYVLQLGVRLDIFFRLLWRHVFTVEIIKAHFNIHTEEQKASFIDRFKNLFRDRRHQKALEYLENWGKSFWEETEYRIKEVTKTFESSLGNCLGGSIFGAVARTGVSESLSEEQKEEIVQRAQYVVNQVQIRELSDIVDLLAEVLSKSQRRYFVVVDRLDEDWVEDRLRYLLIRALIDTVREFRKVPQAKIVIALRYDLIDRVFRVTRNAGFQEEKYASLYLDLRWTRDQLIEIIDSRIEHLVRQRYTKQRMTHRDILPAQIDKQPAIDYLVERTLMRPRDIIQFFNHCISHATNNPAFTPEIVKKAEADYSRSRLRALADEWHADYPNLIRFAGFLKSRPQQFRVSEVDTTEAVELCLEIVADDPDGKGELMDSARRVTDGKVSPEDFRSILFQTYYKVGLVALKMETFESTEWSITGRRNISATEIRPDTRVSVHPCFWRALGVRER